MLAITKAQNTGFPLWMNWKSWCQRCINHLCRWFNRNQRSDRSSFPKTEYQRCIVHQVRNTLKYVPDKDRKAFATDLKTIYQATDEKKALAALERVTENGHRNIRIPWSVGRITGTQSRRSLNFQRRSERWFILQMLLNLWILPTGNWIAREAYFQAIQLY